ncbi:MAG: Hsp70 family protein, partial [Thermoplasmatales archaeon]|nr:Hsp70 family protein [Thermoplasmatales archaeon]
VSAKDLGTGKGQSIRITGSTKLSDAEIERMKEEAKEHEEEDEKRKEKIEVRNTADALVHNTEKTMEELKDKFSEDDKKNIEKALKELREALTGDDIDKIKEKTDALMQVLQKASATIYQQAAQQQQQQAAGDTDTDESWQGKPSDDDKTINADYKVKDDEKKDDNKD